MTDWLRSRMLGVGLLVMARAVWAAEPIVVPMVPEHWQAKEVHGTLEDKPVVEFGRIEGFPAGFLRVKAGSVVLKDFTFRNGTIEMDVNPLGGDIPGIRFRQRDEQTAEEFYFRPGPNCGASDDCIQYVPMTHGVFLWNMYPQYQRPAPVHAGWNHLKLVISGRRMNVFVNGAATPTMAVGRLEGDALEGGIQLRGPAIFANLVVTPDAVEGLSPVAERDPTDGDGRYVRRWEMSAPAVLRNGETPQISAMPRDSGAWRGMAAEDGGVVNVARAYGSPTDKSVSSVVWLKTTIESDRAQTKRVAMGWIGETWIYVNGRLVTAGRNQYYPEFARRMPDGRLSLENGSFAVPLSQGRNEVVVALSNNTANGHNHYGWGMVLRFDDLAGIGLQPGKMR